MAKLTYLGALALLTVPGAAGADWRTPIQGAKPILATGFTPMRYAVMEPVTMAALESADMPDMPPSPQKAPSWTPDPSVWSMPLVDRRLTSAQRAADLAPELVEAVSRIEPMYDPTRLDGPDSPSSMVVSAGTAAMNNVFADHWRIASPDPNINVKTRYLANVWAMSAPPPCEALAKNRPHGFNEPALNALSAADCRDVQRYEAMRFDATPTPEIVPASVSVPIFAAPLPGSRMPSNDFWARQKARVEAIEARLHQKWQVGQAQAMTLAPAQVSAPMQSVMAPITRPATVPAAAVVEAHVDAKARANAGGPNLVAAQALVEARWVAKARADARAAAKAVVRAHVDEAPAQMLIQAKAPREDKVRDKSLTPTQAKILALVLAQTAPQQKTIQVSDLGLRP